MRTTTFLKMALAMALWPITMAAEDNLWNTLYSFNSGRIYVHLKNNDLVALNFSMSGFENLSKYSNYSESEVLLLDGQHIQSLSAPPANSSLVLINDKLYAFSGVSDTKSKQDVCGDGVLSLLQYDDEKDLWDASSDVSFGSIPDASYYRYATYMSSPTQEDTIYVYGGLCDSSGDVSSRLLSFDTKEFTFSAISTTTKPQPFYGASNLVAPNPQTQLVIGGQSSNGWLNMYQLATWNFQSGWSFQQIPNSGPSINARKFALTLPIFSQLPNNSASTLSNYYSVEQVLLIGGEILEDTPSTPTYGRLLLHSNEWEWQQINHTNVNVDDILGAATVFNTLVVVNSTGVSKRDGASLYQVSLYDADTFQSVSNLKDNVSSSSSSGSPASSSTTSTLTKAIVGTLVPVAAIAMAVGAALFMYKRKNKDNDQAEAETIDYQFGNYYDQISSGGYKVQTQGPYKNDNDTNSTLDVASIDSWVKKRQEFDEKRTKTIKRNSYLASSETLSEGKRLEELKQGLADDNPYSYQPEPAPRPSIYGAGIVNKSVTKLKKTLSFTNTPPGSPGIGSDLGVWNKRSYSSLRPPPKTRIMEDDVLDNEQEQDETANDTRSIDLANIDTTNEDIDEAMSETDLEVESLDVQVLVSSKRRSTLRVINPDLQTIPDEDEDEEEDTVFRQRVPSGDRHEDA